MDDLKSKRMDEFVWYHIHGDGDCNGQVLKAFTDIESLDQQSIFDLTYFYSITYSIPSAIFLLQNRNKIINKPVESAEEFKKFLVFETDRKWVKQEDRFDRMLHQWAYMIRNYATVFERQVVENNIVRTKKALSIIENWYYFSRYSAYLFIETYCDIKGLQCQKTSGLNYDGDRMVFASGLFRLYGLDKMAVFCRFKRTLPVDSKTFECMIQDVQNRVLTQNGDDNWFKIETSLCAYEKFYRGTRYNGYYADRMLQDINNMKGNHLTADACSKTLQARKIAIKKQYLGEANGWDGIRKELKKQYIQTGEIFGYQSILQ